MGTSADLAYKFEALFEGTFVSWASAVSIIWTPGRFAWTILSQIIGQCASQSFNSLSTDIAIYVWIYVIFILYICSSGIVQISQEMGRRKYSPYQTLNLIYLKDIIPPLVPVSKKVKNDGSTKTTMQIKI
jgi:hypothetical protein